MNPVTLAEWLQWLELQHPSEIELGLERIRVVALRLGVLQPKATVVTVAGTNGKGSFVASLAAILRAHGKRVACYTSPHLFHFHERIDLDGTPPHDEALVAAFGAVESCREGVPLTYFEFTTLAALHLFRQQPFDLLILEVGLGGRLDAVNILTPDWAVITSIGLDHQEYLGDTREAIAFEKCGILRPDTPLVCAESDPPSRLQEAINTHPALWIGRDFSFDKEGDGWCCQISSAPEELANLRDNGLSIPSQAAAIALATRLLRGGGSAGRVADAINRCALPGRFQRTSRRGVTIILDVAHNAQAAGMLRGRLLHLPMQAGAKRLAVFSLLRDKDAGSVIAELQGVFPQWHVGRIAHHRAAGTDDLVDSLHRAGEHIRSVSDTVQGALQQAMEDANPGDVIVIFGSFHVVAECLTTLGESKA